MAPLTHEAKQVIVSSFRPLLSPGQRGHATRGHSVQALTSRAWMRWTGNGNRS